MGEWQEIETERKIKRVVATMLGVKSSAVSVMYGFRIGCLDFTSISVEVDLEYGPVDLFRIEVKRGTDSETARKQLLRSVLSRCDRVAKAVRGTK